MTTEAGARPPSSGDLPTLTGQIAAADLRRGEVLAGRFRVDAMLGVGGMGVVYRAHDLALGLDVAIKLLRPELARKPEAFERFRQELLLARQVSSPHVVRIHDIAQADGRWFISMDFVDGPSLESRMDGGKLDTAAALGIAHDLLEGLSAAHARGVVHRDLKPANVLLDRAGRAYITDFGVARSLGASGGLTQSGVIFGTPEYLSPEQARGDAVDARSDLYAVGLIVYEMLSGSLPFRGGTPAETVVQRIVRQPPSLATLRPDLPHWLHALCDRLLKLQPMHRFASAREALQALETKHVPRAPLDRRVLLLALLGLVALGGAADLVYRYAARTPAPAVAALPATPRIAVLPLQASGEGAAAAARALEQDLRDWLRADAARGVVPRARTLDALARTLPDAAQRTPETIARQRVDLARAAQARWLIGGTLGRTPDGGFTLELALHDATAAASAAPLHVQAADAAQLFTAYRAAAPAWFQAAANPADAPALAAGSVAAYGEGLLALDRNDAAAAEKALDLPPESRTPALTLALLQAQDRAGDDAAAQATRSALAPHCTSPQTPIERAVCAEALAGGEGDAAARALQQAHAAFPHDDTFALDAADALSDAGNDKAAAGLLRAVLQSDDQDARAWYLLGRSAIKLGDAQPAVDDYLVHALVLDTRAANESALGDTLNALGVGYERLGQLDAAVEQYTRAAALREKRGDEAGLAKSLRNLAIVQAERGERAAADKALERVRSLLEKRGDRASLADLYNDRGVVAEERGDFAAALADYRQALAMRQQLDEPALVAESLNNVGYAAYQMGDFDNAGAYLQQALAQFQKLDDRTRALHVGQSMALLDIARGHFAAAGTRLAQSLREAEDHQLPEESAVAYVTLADLAALEGRFDDALAANARARRIFERRGDRRGRDECALQQARTALAGGQAGIADTALRAIDAKALNTEQRAAFELARAQRAALGDDSAQAATALDAAAKAAADSHSGRLAAAVELARAELALRQGDAAGARKRLEALRVPATRLADVPTRLEWLQDRLTVALQTERAAAPALYREALNLLKTAGRYRDAAVLHALGAQATAAAEAAAARTAAEAARKDLLDAAPAAWRDGLAASLARRSAEAGARGR